MFFWGGKLVIQSLSHVRLFATPWTAASLYQASLSFTISLSLLKRMSVESMIPSNHLILCRPLLLLSIFPASGSFPMNRLFSSSGQSIVASSSASVLPTNIQSWFPLRLTGWSPCTPRDSKESSPAPQSESINSLVLSLLKGPTLISTHDDWKNHSFDYSFSTGK